MLRAPGEGEGAGTFDPRGPSRHGAPPVGDVLRREGRHGTRHRGGGEAGGPSLATLHHALAVTSVAFSSSGMRIVTAGGDHTARVWTADGDPVHTLEGHTQAIVQAAFSSDGTRIVTASSDGTARVWSTALRSLVASLAGHQNRVTSAAWSGDGLRILTASSDGTARVWEAVESLVSSRAMREPPILPPGLRVEAREVFTDDDDEPVTVLASHESQVLRAWFSEDDTSVVATYQDGTELSWIIDPVLVRRALWLSTPHCPDADELRRLLNASPAAADAAYKACERMSNCLRVGHGTPMASRFPACFATFREEQARVQR
jgi:WD40 repeat protein